MDSELIYFYVLKLENIFAARVAAAYVERTYCQNSSLAHDGEDLGQLLARRIYKITCSKLETNAFAKHQTNWTKFFPLSVLRTCIRWHNSLALNTCESLFLLSLDPNVGTYMSQVSLLFNVYQTNTKRRPARGVTYH